MVSGQGSETYGGLALVSAVIVRLLVWLLTRYSGANGRRRVRATALSSLVLVLVRLLLLVRLRLMLLLLLLLLLLLPLPLFVEREELLADSDYVIDVDSALPSHCAEEVCWPIDDDGGWKEKERDSLVARMCASCDRV